MSKTSTLNNWNGSTNVWDSGKTDQKTLKTDYYEINPIIPKISFWRINKVLVSVWLKITVYTAPKFFRSGVFLEMSFLSNPFHCLRSDLNTIDDHFRSLRSVILIFTATTTISARYIYTASHLVNALLSHRASPLIRNCSSTKSATRSPTTSTWRKKRIGSTSPSTPWNWWSSSCSSS